MRDDLEQKLARYEEIDKLLMDPEVLGNGARLTALSRERGALAKLAGKYKQFKDLNRQIAETNEMIESGDKDMRELAEAELPDLRAAREKVWDE
ncbi:MAG: PCRF domain-containing protein, partial [Planctomycetales bacterium]|nr:PCRF domain-containing protein [Planctomycetales bacterium]